jgi:phage-related protein
MRERGRRFADSRSRFEAVWDNIYFSLQMGEQLGTPHSRPMKSVATGVWDVRVRGEDGIYRAFYYTAHAEGIIVFHAFMKKTQ